jgi:hypothetical protein
LARTQFIAYERKQVGIGRLEKTADTVRTERKSTRCEFDPDFYGSTVGLRLGLGGERVLKALAN